MDRTQVLHRFGVLITPLAKRAALRRVRQIEKRLDRLSRRLGLLQMGQFIELFERVAGLSDIAEGGLGARNALAVIREVLTGPGLVNFVAVESAVNEIAQYIQHANMVLDAHDRGRPKAKRLFVVRRRLKGLF